MWLGDGSHRDPSSFGFLVVCAMLGGCLGVVIGTQLGYQIATRRYERAAVRSGQAEYVVGSSGESVWRMKPVKP